MLFSQDRLVSVCDDKITSKILRDDYWMKTYEYDFVRIAEADGRMRQLKAVEEDVNKFARGGFRFHSIVLEGVILMEKTIGDDSKEKGEKS